MLDIVKRNYLKIFSIILTSLIIDNLLIYLIDNPPAWDQGFHLSNVFKMYNILDDNNLNLLNKSNKILEITDNYRGPLTYFLSALFLKIFDNSYHYAYLSNQIFNIICIFSIYKLAILFKDSSTGVWASLIFSFSSLIINLRSDYLIDLSLTAFCSLTLFIFTKWYLEKKLNNYYAILSGVSLGLIFLVKPSGIAFFILPFLTIFFNLLINRKSTFSNISQTSLFIFSFILIIFPWFSRHWLTIITSTINAWNWGIDYQEGYEINSLDSWLYYIKLLPKIFGIFSSSILFLIFIFEKISQKNLLKINFKKLDKINLWFLIYFLNCYLIVSLMSTKDIRFILPIYPLLCIYLSKFITTKNFKYFTAKSKKIILVTTIILSLLASKYELIFKNINKNLTYEWPHYEIIKEIKSKTPNLNTTLAILPDTKEINTFNLEAEAAKQGEYVAVRQIISNEETYKDDLKYFDWFLLKTGSQGVMSNKSKNLLSKYLLNNSFFIIDNEWELRDKTKIILMRRKTSNTLLSKRNCTYKSPKINITQINNGIKISYIGKGKSLFSSKLLIDLIGTNFKQFINVSLANGFFDNSFDEESCYFLSQDFPIDFPENISKNLSVKVKLLNKYGEIRNLKNINKNLILEEKFFEKENLYMANRIEKVQDLGIFLRKGQFKNLFDLVGILNQSDPKQIYLKDAEIIYLQRYKEKEDINDLYSLLISQILQRKALEAKETVNKIIEKDQNNGNTYLAKSIINIFLLDKKAARESIEKTIKSDKSIESSEILEIADGLTYFLEMKFINAWQSFK